MHRGRRHLTAALVVALALTALVAGPGIATSAAQTTTAPTNCGNTGRATNVVATGVPCDKALQVAMEYARTRLPSIAGFQCSAARTGRRSFHATCTQGANVVTFDFTIRRPKR